MPIDLRNGQKERLLRSLIDALPHIKADHGMFINRKSALILAICDSVLPSEGKLHERLVDYVDEFPVTNFVLDTVGWELWELDQYQSEPASVQLCEIEAYKDPEVVAKRLVDDFLTLPWKYTLSFLLPETLTTLLRADVDEFALSPTVKLVRATDQFAAQFPLTGTSEGDYVVDKPQ
jgi:hypothetical protein